uniref:Uncharacterized protein n=1 Tax=Branchiostoma floridae TaxID=7739 RepID=C3ZGF8_BRAFL|eukprot:XP_002592328.1 hypothetical protein BRAFLDRAFT_240135 [Branchiostoma floridae]
MADNPNQLNVLIVAAIDFGTSFSAYGFSLSDSKDDEKSDVPIYLNKNWGQILGHQSYKAPTSLLLSPDREFVAFGFEALQKYATLTENKKDKSHYFFEHFKMRLHSNHTTIRKDITLTAADGRTLPALDVFSHALKFISDHLRDAVKVSTGADIQTHNIRWVITVPAIWNEAAKQFMREAAYKAGIASRDQRNRLLIALEPEASSLFCRQLPVDLWSLVETNRLVLSPHTCAEEVIMNLITAIYVKFCQRIPLIWFYMVNKCLVFQITGGTVDVTVHELRDDGSVRELHRPTGGPWGGTNVDSNFSNLLDKIFGQKFMSRYRHKFPQENVCLMADFEMKKRSATDVSVQLNYNFLNFLSKFSKSKDIAEIVSNSNVEGVRFLNGQLRMSEEVIQSLFQPILDQITSHIQSLLTKPKLSNIKTIFLVGGFADSPLLSRAVMDSFSDRGVRVLVPEGASLAVIKGAVLFGRNPDAIKERVSARTYGVMSSTAFIEGVHPPQKKVDEGGLTLCKDVFNKLVGVDEAVALYESKSMEFKAIRDNQEGATVYLFCSRERNPKFITDDDMSICGQVHVDMPDIRGGKDRTIEIKFTFGRTEIDVQAEDLTSHTRAFTTIDFLQY